MKINLNFPFCFVAKTCFTRCLSSCNRLVALRSVDDKIRPLQIQTFEKNARRSADDRNERVFCVIFKENLFKFTRNIHEVGSKPCSTLFKQTFMLYLIIAGDFYLFFFFCFKNGNTLLLGKLSLLYILRFMSYVQSADSLCHAPKEFRFQKPISQTELSLFGRRQKKLGDRAEVGAPKFERQIG